MKKTFLLFFVCNCALTFLSLPAAGVPLEVYSIDGPQDPLLLNGHVHELGEFVFPPDEEVISFWNPTDQTACFDGSDDPMIPNINARAMAALIPDSRLEFVDCGHMFILTKLKEVAPKIESFLCA